MKRAAMIVFSKDRALQLHAFLRSVEKYVDPIEEVHVLFAVSSSRHRAAYWDVFDLWSWVAPHEQTSSFKSDVLDLLPTEGNVIFFVDDQVFIRPWNRFELSGLSLRLGMHLTRNYASWDAFQPLPQFYSEANDMLTWRWGDGIYAWGYPLSVDGHLFGSLEMRRLIDGIEFNCPNAFEAALQRYLPQFSDRWGSCYREARVVNVPWNQVQDFCNNRVAVTGVRAEEMLEHWEAGKQIDLAPLYGVVNESVHQEFPFAVEAR